MIHILFSAIFHLVNKTNLIHIMWQIRHIGGRDGWELWRPLCVIHIFDYTVKRAQTAYIKFLVTLHERGNCMGNVFTSVNNFAFLQHTWIWSVVCNGVSRATLKVSSLHRNSVEKFTIVIDAPKNRIQSGTVSIVFIWDFKIISQYKWTVSGHKYMTKFLEIHKFY